MTEETVFRSVKRACYAGLDSVSLRRTVAERLGEWVPSDGYAFGTTDPTTGLLTHMVANGLPSRMSEQFVEVIYPYELVHLHHEMVRSGNLVFSATKYIPEMQDHLRTSGFGYEVHVVAATGGRMWGKCCFMHAGPESPSDARGRGILRRITPHLTRALRTASLLERGLAPSTAIADLQTPGVLVLDERNRPRIRTNAALRILGDIADEGLAMADNIPLSIRLMASALRSRVAHASDYADASGQIVTNARGASGYWYSIRASLAEPDAAGACAIVMIMQPLSRSEMVPVLTQLYGLSAREREVAAAVARGESTKEIARNLGISSHTVVEHIERACHKVGVHGRKALIAQIFFGAYAPGLGAARPSLTSAALRRGDALPG